MAFALQPRKTPQETSVRWPSDERAVRPVIASNGVPFLQMRSGGSHSTSGREKEGNKEMTRFSHGMSRAVIYLNIFFSYRETCSMVEQDSWDV